MRAGEIVQRANYGTDRGWIDFRETHVRQVFVSNRKRRSIGPTLKCDHEVAVGRPDRAYDRVKGASERVGRKFQNRAGIEWDIDQKTDQRWMAAQRVHHFCNLRNGGASADRRIKIIRIDRDFDHRAETSLAREAQNRLGLCLGQNQGVDMRRGKFIQALTQRELLAEVERAGNARQAHRLQEEFSAGSAEKFPVGGNRRKRCDNRAHIQKHEPIPCHAESVIFSIGYGIPIRRWATNWVACSTICDRWDRQYRLLLHRCNLCKMQK